MCLCASDKFYQKTLLAQQSLWQTVRFVIKRSIKVEVRMDHLKSGTVDWLRVHILQTYCSDSLNRKKQVFRTNQHLQNKGKTKHIVFWNNCVDRFMAHSTENLDDASNTNKSIHLGLNTNFFWLMQNWRGI